MKQEGDKHPINFDGYSPEEFVEKFVCTNYYYQKEVFELMVKKYVKEAEGDRDRPSLKNLDEGRVQLASGLEKIANAIKGPVLDAMKEICSSCKGYLKNPYCKIN